MEKHWCLRINGPDQAGLIHKITATIFYQGLNVISNSEFVEPESNHFFMRSEFVGKLNKENLLAGLSAALSGEFEIELSEHQPKKCIVFATKEHHCLADILIRNEYKNLNLEILAVVSNYEDLRPLVEKFNLSFHYLPHNDKKREEHEKEITDLISSEYSGFDYLILAKYMRILTPQFVQKYNNKIINIHHSFLPAFIGANPYKEAYERGVKIIGATSHFVNEELDTGPIIVQEITHVNHTYNAEDMKCAGQDAEVLALSKALKLVFEDRVFINTNKTIILQD